MNAATSRLIYGWLRWQVGRFQQLGIGMFLTRALAQKAWGRSTTTGSLKPLRVNRAYTREPLFSS